MTLSKYLLRPKKFQKKEFPETEILNSIKMGGVSMERATTKIINQFQGYQWMFLKAYGLEKEEAIDAFTDAVLSLIECIRSNQFNPQYSISTCLFRLTRNRCIDRLRKKGRGKNLVIEELPEHLDIPHSQNMMQDLLMSESYKHVLEILNNFQGKCREILLKWGYYGYSMDEISREMGLANADVARTTKKRCLSRLRKNINQTHDFPSPKLS